MKFLFQILFIVFFANANGQELQPIKGILADGIRNNDDTQISYVLKRCLSLNLVLGNWMEEKGGERMKKSVANFFNQALFLQDFIVKLENDIEKAKNIKLSTKQEIEKTLLLNVKLISPLYVERLSRNYAASGSYFEKDAQLIEEIEICSDFQKYVDSLK